MVCSLYQFALLGCYHWHFCFTLEQFPCSYFVILDILDTTRITEKEYEGLWWPWTKKNTQIPLSVEVNSSCKLCKYTMVVKWIWYVASVSVFMILLLNIGTLLTMWYLFILIIIQKWNICIQNKSNFCKMIECFFFYKHSFAL